MSRHGYHDDCDLDPLDLGRWRGRVASAIRGRRGQKLLRDLVAALDAMPEKCLIARELESEGQVCALGAVGLARGIDMSGIDPEDAEQIAVTFDIAEPLAREIMYENDDEYHDMTPERRWEYMRSWAEKRIKKDSE
jgi:hypothetical protein